MYGAQFSSGSSSIGNTSDMAVSRLVGPNGTVASARTGAECVASAPSQLLSNNSLPNGISHNDAGVFRAQHAETQETRLLPQQAAEPSGSGSQDSSAIGIDAEAIWQAARSQLALQMPSATYDTWMRDTKVVAYEDGEFIIGIPNAYVRDWLENRLRLKIKKTLSSLIGRSVQVNFRVVPPKASNESTKTFAPLYENQSAQPPTGPGSTGFDYAHPDAENQLETGSDPMLPKSLHESKPVKDHYINAQSVNGQSLHDQKLYSADGFSASDSQATESMSDGIKNGTDWRGTTLQGSGMLNPTHTFDNLVVGNHNRLAHAAAQAIAESPGQSFNPLFVYGGVGLGKTHLLHAVGNQARQQGFRLLYCSSEQFTHELIMAIRSQSTEDFRNKYRQVDILLIDDIQFISGKESTQEEFFHTFNYLHAAGRQVVLSSDRQPKALGTLDDRLRSRFEGGLQTDISQPDFETRVAILQSKALKTDLRIHRDVLMLIAERVESNVRELEGVLNRMILQARLFSGSLDLALAENILRNLAPQRTPRSPSIVIRIVAEYYHLHVEDLTGRTRTKDIAHARQAAMYLLREENGLSLPAIGDHLGGRDHSTVRYGVDKITNDLEADETLRREIATLREKIYLAPAL